MERNLRLITLALDSLDDPRLKEIRHNEWFLVEDESKLYRKLPNGEVVSFTESYSNLEVPSERPILTPSVKYVTDKLEVVESPLAAQIKNPVLAVVHIRLGLDATYLIDLTSIHDEYTSSGTVTTVLICSFAGQEVNPYWSDPLKLLESQSDMENSTFYGISSEFLQRIRNSSTNVIISASGESPDLTIYGEESFTVSNQDMAVRSYGVRSPLLEVFENYMIPYFGHTKYSEISKSNIKSLVFTGRKGGHTTETRPYHVELEINTGAFTKYIVRDQATSEKIVKTVNANITILSQSPILAKY